jgi:hypothetical protein
MIRKLFIILALVTLPTLVYAETTITNNGCYPLGSNVIACSITYLDDTNGITDESIAVSSEVKGWQIASAIHVPGSTALTETADITLKIKDIDPFNGRFDNCGGSSNTQVNFTQIIPTLTGSVTFTLANNAVNNATGDFIMFFYK